MKLERILKTLFWLFPVIVLVIFGVVSGIAMQSPDGALTQDYKRGLDCDDAFCNAIIRLLKTADFLGGGVPTAQLLWYGIPLLLFGWMMLARTVVNFKPDVQHTHDDSGGE